MFLDKTEKNIEARNNRESREYKYLKSKKIMYQYHFKEIEELR